MVKICGLQRGTFMCRNTAGLEGDDLIGAQGYPPKGAHHGDADTTDHQTLGNVLQSHCQSFHGDGMLWPGTFKCGCRACSARLEWYTLPRVNPEWDASQWDALPRAPPEWDAHAGDAHAGATLQWN